MISEEELLRRAVATAGSSEEFSKLVDEPVFSVRLGLSCMQDSMCMRLPCLVRGYLAYNHVYPSKNQFTVATTLHTDFLLKKINELENKVKELEKRNGRFTKLEV